MIKLNKKVKQSAQEISALNELTGWESSYGGGGIAGFMHRVGLGARKKSKKY